MKSTFKILSAAAVAIACLTPATAQTFTHKSILSEGKWTKVGVTATGLYEITYEQLAEMGFEDPASVAVYGQGGRQLSIDFVSSAKEELYIDDLKETPIFHEGGKLYFYALGTDWHEYTKGSKASYFTNKGLNIYSEKGYYFLTDSRTPKLMENPAVSQSQLTSSIELKDGLWYVAHEVDLKQGCDGTGQLFWGEDFSRFGAPRYEWAVTLPDVVPDAPGIMAADFYKHKNETLTLKYGLIESAEGYNNLLEPSNLTYYQPVSPGYCTITPTGESQTAFMEVSMEDGGDRPSSAVRLDHWTITYSRKVPTLTLTSQDGILFPGVAKNTNHNAAVPAGESSRVIQISNPYKPQILTITPFGPEGRVNFTAATANPSLLYFDVSKPQMQISGFEEIANQNIHGEAIAARPEMAIITTPEFYAQAERLADLHRSELGQKVFVVTNTQLYNEFSSGRPDPMAYRAFVKMLRMENSQEPIKNLLLYGPLSRDIRSTEAVAVPDMRLIAMQNRADKLPYDTGAASIAFDFYGIALSTIGTTFFENCQVHVGVGYLTVQNQTEADNIYDKIRDYINDDTFAYRINKTISAACEGDNNMHADQAISLGNLFNNYQNHGNITSLVLLDHTGYEAGRDRLLSLLDEGAIAWNYFGHSNQSMLGSKQGFFSSGSSAELRNRHLPFVTFGGCDLTLADHNMRGIGEHVILDNRYGGIASIVSTRQAWSNPNETMMRSFYRDWTHEDPQYDQKGEMLPLVTLSEPQTLGQVYARMKSNIKLSNELVYFLVGDPGITIPPVLRNISATVKTSGKDLLSAGHEAEISGTIDKNGQTDTDFNGEVVIRVMEPEIQAAISGMESHGVNGKIVTFADFQAAVGHAEVTNGRFVAKVVIPASMQRFEGKSIRIVAGAYDHSKRIGAAGECQANMTSSSEAGLAAPVADTQAPSIMNLAYNAELNIIEAEAEDNVAIATGNSPMQRPGCLLSIDGKTVSGAASALIHPSDDGRSGSMEFPLHTLTMGEHVANLEVSDAAGNSAISELRFTVNPGWAALTLELDNIAADGDVKFIVSGAVDDVLTLCILDPDGNEIYTRTGSIDEMTWNCKNKEYEHVAPGIYKAYVRESGRPGHRAHSATISIPVI